MLQNLELSAKARAIIFGLTKALLCNIVKLEWLSQMTQSDLHFVKTYSWYQYLVNTCNTLVSLNSTLWLAYS